MSVNAIEERRAGRRRRRRRLVIWASILGIAAFIAAIGIVGTLISSTLNADEGPAAREGGPAPEPERQPVRFWEDEPATTPGAEPCVTVSVLSSFENAEMVANLAAAYNASPRDVGGACVTVLASKDKSGVAASLVADGFPNSAPDQKPTVWLPDSRTWFDVARTQGATSLSGDGSSVASSAVVVAMPASLAAAIDWDDEPPTWADVFDAAEDASLWEDLGHPEWGAFKLGKTSPLIATSGEAAMFASFGTAAGSLDSLTESAVTDPAVVEEVRLHELATSHYMATPEHFLWHARQAEANGSAADFLSAVIVDEKSVWDYNRGITSPDGITRTEGAPPIEPLVPIYPTDGLYAADNPAIGLTGEWIDPTESAAAADFIRFAHTTQGQAAVRATGYRDLNAVLDPQVASVGNLAGDPGDTLAHPEPAVVTAVHAAFADVRKRANVLFLIDVSASMADPISPSETKLTAAKKAIVLALDHFTAGDHVGVAAFAQDAGGVLVPGEVSTVTDIGTSRDAFLGALGGLSPLGATPLYQAVDTFAARQAQSWSADRINAVILLSDGKNDIIAPTIGADQMLTNLQNLHHSTPVLVFTLAYGADADVATLQSIAGATGAHYYDATDPTKVEAVLGDLVTSF